MAITSGDPTNPGGQPAAKYKVGDKVMARGEATGATVVEAVFDPNLKYWVYKLQYPNGYTESRAEFNVNVSGDTPAPGTSPAIGSAPVSPIEPGGPVGGGVLGPTPIIEGREPVPEPGGPVGGGISGPTPIVGGAPPPSGGGVPTVTPGPVPGSKSTTSQDELKKQVQIALANKDPDLARKLAEAWFLANKFGDPKKSAADFLSKISPVSDEAARAERFGGTAGGRAGIFGEFLRQQNPNYDLFTPGVQATMERDLPALEESFMLEPANFGGAGEGKGPSTSFEQMLKSGRSAMSPDEIQKRLVDLSNFNPANSGPESFEGGLLSRYGTDEGGDQAAFTAAVMPFLQNIDPAMRQNLLQSARRRFGRMQMQPTTRFIDKLREMGGKFFNF